MTGSVDQQGNVQSVGAINEKVESFFDVCAAKGLTSSQGVLIPATNRQSLMLRKDIVEAVAEGRFHVYAVATVEEGIELLTGAPAGKQDAFGRYPDGSVYRAAAVQLERFHEAIAALSS